MFIAGWHIRVLSLAVLSHRCQLMAFSVKADPINWSAFLNPGTDFGFSCSFVIRLQHCPYTPVDWGQVNWGPLSSFAMKQRQSDLLKLETENGENEKYTSRKSNAILLNIKVNRPKLVSVCVDINWQQIGKNFTEIYLTWVKTIAKSFKGYFFDLHCMSIHVRCNCRHQRNRT